VSLIGFSIFKIRIINRKNKSKSEKIYHLSSKKSKKDCSDLLMNLFIKKLSGTKITKEKNAYDGCY
jgi:hypothetical protein